MKILYAALWGLHMVMGTEIEPEHSFRTHYAYGRACTPGLEVCVLNNKQNRVIDKQHSTAHTLIAVDIWCMVAEIVAWNSPDYYTQTFARTCSGRRNARCIRKPAFQSMGKFRFDIHVDRTKSRRRRRRRIQKQRKKTYEQADDASTTLRCVCNVRIVWRSHIRWLFSLDRGQF